MKLWVVLLISAFAITSCQNKESQSTTPEFRDTDITADVLGKVASKIEYRSHNNTLTILNDGTYKLRFDGIVQEYLQVGVKLPPEVKEARCLVDFEGKIKFFKATGVRSMVPLFTRASMTFSFASVVKSEATSNSKVDGDDSDTLYERCRSFANAVFIQEPSDNYVISYDEMAVVFPGLHFNVKNKKESSNMPFKFRASLTTGDLADYDIIRHSYSNIYFVTNGGDVDITEMFFNDLKGKMKSLGGEIDLSDLDRVELKMYLENDLKMMSVSQKECGITYLFYILNARMKKDGVSLKLLATQNAEYDSTNLECLALDAKIRQLGGVTRISYANQTKRTDDPNNILKFYMRQPDGTTEPWTFTSK